MGKNVAVFVDVANIFYAAKAAGVDIDYVLLLKAATAGRDLVRAYAYTGLDPDNENQRNFHSFLARNSFKVVSKDIRKYGDGKVKANLDIELVVDLMKTSRNLDVAVVVSGDGDFAPAIRAVQETGVRVEVISFRGNTSSDLMEVADKFTDITQLAKVEKGSTVSGRRVASDDEDLSMTEVPDKESEGTGRGRGRGRGRARPERVEEPVAEAAGTSRGRGRGRRIAAEPAVVPVAAGGGALVALPGEKLSKAAAARLAEQEAVAVEDEAEDLVAGEAVEVGDAEGEMAEDGTGTHRRRRRRGGRGRGRGRGTEQVTADGAPVTDEELAEDEEEEEEEVGEPARPAPRPAAFGSVWDSQIGVPSAPRAATPGDDEEYDDEPAIPEYLLAERRGGQRGGQRSGSAAASAAAAAPTPLRSIASATAGVAPAASPSRRVAAGRVAARAAASGAASVRRAPRSRRPCATALPSGGPPPSRGARCLRSSRSSCAPSWPRSWPARTPRHRQRRRRPGSRAPASRPPRRPSRSRPMLLRQRRRRPARRAPGSRPPRDRPPRRPSRCRPMLLRQRRRRPASRAPGSRPPRDRPPRRPSRCRPMLLRQRRRRPASRAPGSRPPRDRPPRRRLRQRRRRPASRAPASRHRPRGPDPGTPGPEPASMPAARSRGRQPAEVPPRPRPGPRLRTPGSTRFATRGQPVAVAAVERMLEVGAPQALLLVGPGSVGKTTLALDLAAGLLCHAAEPVSRPCGSCRSCRLIDAGEHQDLHRLVPEGPGLQVRIGDPADPEPGTVRHLLRELARLPVEGARRVALVEGAHRLNEDAQNALLKTLEEPPASATLILCADEPERLLPTVRSRTAVLRLGPVGIRAMEELLAEHGVEPPRSARLARLADGRPGLALALAVAPEAVAAREEVARSLLDLAALGTAERLLAGRELLARSADLARLGGAPAAALAALASPDAGTVDADPDARPARGTPAERRLAAAALLATWTAVARDVAVVAAGSRASVRDPALLDDLEAVASRMPHGAPAAFAGRLARSAELLEANANPELLVDVLVLAWPRLEPAIPTR